MLSRYARMFETLKAKQECALIPFLMLGDPDAASFLAHVNAVVDAGADALELGLPFSDPVADGPTLVAAARRALNGGMTTSRCFELVNEIRAKHPHLPIGLLVYTNLVFARGIDRFLSDASAANVDSLLIADMPLREADTFRQLADRHAIDTVFILSPDADNETLRKVADGCRGYTYVLGRKGVTGAGNAIDLPMPERLATLKAAGAPPAVIGFGISKPAHVRAAINAGASGVIVGSALVDVFARGGDGAALVAELKSATYGD